MVEDRRAAGEGELGEADARRGVLRLFVDRRPDRVQRLEPAEEVLVLRTRTREVLPEVMVRVHEPWSHNRAAEVVRSVRAAAKGSGGEVLEPGVHEPTSRDAS